MTSSAGPRELLTVDEAAARVRATSRQIRNRIATGRLPAIRPAGAKAYLIAVDDLDRLYAAQVRESRAAERTSPSARERDQLVKAGFAER